ncbi:putative endo-1,3(4)-beta-glucanase [Talaromyces proteolyticus]|uniref:endo-1,3(4)-beta-glucanase n=1 Tax=Talaromyces proteolyticus TaxID=1131652 RepID=A0AAD4PYX2_9EURO|nr:putative endo-1,3(4)-beta-glucanase [Talaromyces proteolyticus]KAH8702005.1 putative endo-1,3(4)-beta-glucanase [Talaromyces proteolyticus]
MSYQTRPQYPKSEETYDLANSTRYSHVVDGGQPYAAARFSRFNPLGWRRRTQIIAGVAVVVVIIAVIVGAYEGWKANRYPDYSALNYSLKDTYSGEKFFDNFYYWSAADPTAGFVVGEYISRVPFDLTPIRYIAEANAKWSNLTYATSESAIIKVDTSYPNTVGGRNSVRIQSNNTYNDGLFIFDILHTPYGCGTWPALWLSDSSNWPTNGEIDIVEAVNNGTWGNSMTLHTTDDCSMSVKRKESGSVTSTNCYNGTNSNEGCGVSGTTASYGPEFNQNGGGVYATELRDAGIRIWWFPRNSIPSDITNGSPDPSKWGEATADFPSTDCSISSHFKNQSIIANIDLCGSLAGSTARYTDQAECPSNCTSYVAQNPSAFTEAYWEFKSFKVYQAS